MLLCLAGCLASPADRVLTYTDDNITILNRFNSLQLDLNDFISFDLTQFFSYTLEQKPHWKIDNDYKNSITVIVMEKDVSDKKDNPAPVK